VDLVRGVTIGHHCEAGSRSEGGVIGEEVGDVLDVGLVGAVGLVLAGFASDGGVRAVATAQGRQEGGEGEKDGEAPCYSRPHGSSLLQSKRRCVCARALTLS
jgi:hypothetical protein